MDEEIKGKKELEKIVLEKAGEVISAIKDAKHADQVICALHSFAVLLFPIDSSLFSGTLDQSYRDKVCSTNVPSANERSDWWQAFYKGPAFPTLARVLLLDVASTWLACIPFSAKKHVYDVFFVNGLVSEVVQALVPLLRQNSDDGIDTNAVSLNTERLLVIGLLENGGVIRITRELGDSYQSEDHTNGRMKADVCRLAQMITSIPDKARPRTTPPLSSHLFFKEVIIQVLSGVEEASSLKRNDKDCTLLFVGEILSRMSRRGSSDVLLSELTPRVLKHVRKFSSSHADLVNMETDPISQLWSKLMEAISDPYAVERISEQLLHQLATERASDFEAYWTLWILFQQIIGHQSSVRSIFVDKFLLWKVFPVCCLRWILQFSVLKCPPIDNSLAKGDDASELLETTQRVATVWSKREFVQSATIEQQAYVTATVGLCLEKMSKEELDKTTDVMHRILEGVSCRLESPTHLVRKMASSIALVFSKVIDPKNPLYLDDSCTEETIDWEFGLRATEKGILSTSICRENISKESKPSTASVPTNNLNHISDDKTRGNAKVKNKKLSEFKLLDPDEIIDPATLNCGTESDEDPDDNASESSESSSDTSLQPYDLSDDDTDLKRKITQLADVVGALRKTDDVDGVEMALDVSEKLVRASPDELTHVAGDLVRTLIQVRCSDVAEEGNEDSAEEKRQKALVALLVTCPFQSLDTLHKLLYSPNVDTSQRIMIIDIMTEAAQELSKSKSMKPKHKRSALISTVSETQPWFLPSDIGPPGAGSWKEISDTETLLNWSNRYERKLPSKHNQIRSGKTRRWSFASSNHQENQIEWSHNKFPVYAAAFMLPAMQGFDKKRHGVDLLGRDFIVLGKLIHMLGVCMQCASMHPEACALATSLLDMLQSREVCHHKEAYVRRAVLFSSSCVLVALNPSYVASALLEGNLELSKGLEWVRTLALETADSDTDRDCYTMAMACLRLHAELALQASRALESSQDTFKANNVISLSSSIPQTTIKIPYLNL